MLVRHKSKQWELTIFTEPRRLAIICESPVPRELVRAPHTSISHDWEENVSWQCVMIKITSVIMDSNFYMAVASYPILWNLFISSPPVMKASVLLTISWQIWGDTLWEYKTKSLQKIKILNCFRDFSRLKISLKTNVFDQFYWSYSAYLRKLAIWRIVFFLVLSLVTAHDVSWSLHDV